MTEWLKNNDSKKYKNIYMDRKEQFYWEKMYFPIIL